MGLRQDGLYGIDSICLNLTGSQAAFRGLFRLFSK
jgi:hypothetical protein